jgi:hypothetical protein
MSSTVKSNTIDDKSVSRVSVSEDDHESVPNKKQSIAYESGDDLSFPETVILLITTHCGVEINSNNEAKDFTIQEGMTITRSLLTAYSVCKFLGEDMIKQYIELIDDDANYITHITEELRTSVIKYLTRDMRYIDTSKERIKHSKDVIKSLKKELKPDLTSTERREKEKVIRNREKYLKSFDKSYTVTVKKSNEVMLNKIYTRTDSEVTKFDNIIMGVNLPGKPDILKIIQNNSKQISEVEFPPGVSFITLKEIVVFFNEKGVKNLVIFDSSCSNIMSLETGEVDERTARRLSRREITYDKKIKSLVMARGVKKRKTKRRTKRHFRK